MKFEIENKSNDLQDSSLHQEIIPIILNSDDSKIKLLMILFCDE